MAQQRVRVAHRMSGVPPGRKTGPEFHKSTAVPACMHFFLSLASLSRKFLRQVIGARGCSGFRLNGLDGINTTAMTLLVIAVPAVPGLHAIRFVAATAVPSSLIVLGSKLRDRIEVGARN